MWRKMFSCTTTASSITMPIARIRPSIVMLLSVKPITYMNRNVGTIDVGMAKVAISVVRQSRMNSRIVSETSTAAKSRWNLHLVHRAADEPRLVLDHLDLDVGGQAGLQLVQAGLHGVGDLHGVGSRLLLDEEADGVLAVEPA